MAEARVGLAADVSVVAMTSDFGAENRGVDLAVPRSDACFQALLDAFRRDRVVFLRRQRLEPRLLLRSAACFGEIEEMRDRGIVIPSLPQVRMLGSTRPHERIDVPGGPPRVDGHADVSCQPQPSAVTLVHAVPCARAGWAAWGSPPPMTRIGRLFVERVRGMQGSVRRQHTPSARETEPKAQLEVEHPRVRRHPATGTRTLFACGRRVTYILGLPTEAGRLLLEARETFATQPRFIYSHAWCQGDVLVRSNCCTLHRSMPFDSRAERVLHRVRVQGEAPLSA